jgi:Putative viral replication protein.
MADKKNKKSVAQLKGRKWQITINNIDEIGIDFDNLKNIIKKRWPAVEYFCYCEEVGKETGKRHWHIFIKHANGINGSSILKVFPGAHLEYCVGTCKKNRDYIYKEGSYEGSEKEDTRQEGMQYEFGECPEESQGQRNDLIELRELIKTGKSNAEIYSINAQYLKYANSIDKIRLDILSDKNGNEWRDIEVTYIEGATGTGKTRGIVESYGYRNIWRIVKDDYSWNGYVDQDVAVFEEFRNTFAFTDMLNFLDGHPVQGRAMHGFRQLGYKNVFMCSNWRLDEQYKNIQEEHPRDWQAFLRRINKVIIREKAGDKVFYQKNRGTEEEPQYDFVSADGVSYFDPFGLKEWGETDNDFWHTLDDFDGNDLFDTPQEKEEVKETKQVEIGKSVLGHIYTTDCEYYYQYPCADIEKPKFIYKKCVVPPHLNEYECKENIKEFEKIHRLLEAQKAKEEKEKKEKEEKLLKEFENITEDEY